MGNKDQREDREIKSNLRKGDEQLQIVGQEARIDAYIARTSETQARLLKTIDVCNSLKAQHVIDLTAKELETKNLCHKIERWRTFAKALEVERDDLKSVVEDLIQKVQMSNDWSMWPSSCMNITKHLQQLPENRFKYSDRSCTDSHNILEYGASVITRLRTELDYERKAHCKAVEEANLRISELEAKVAAREAVLEASIPHRTKGNKSPLDRSRLPRSSNSVIPLPKPMTDEDCLRVLADSNARNKFLELEVRSLARKLDHARGAVGSSPCVPANVASICPSSLPTRASPDRPHQPVTPMQPPTTLGSDTPLTSPPNQVSPLPAAATRILSQDRPINSSTSVSQGSIAQLDHQINSYATQLEAFKAERKTLVEVAVRERRMLKGEEPPGLRQILDIEEECVRLASHITQLQQKLEQSASSAKSRELELLKEINALKLSLRQQVSSAQERLCTPLNLCQADDAQHLDVVDVKQNMKLATPLPPTAILPYNDPISMASPMNPLLNPVLFLPERNSSPIISPSHSLPRPRSPHPVRLRRLEDELEVAKAQLTMKQLALDQLKLDMEELQHLLSEEPP